MFFREKETKTTRVLQLVESRRDAAGKVRQKLIVSLGGCWVPDDCRKAVAQEVEQRLAGYERILPDDPQVAEWTERVLSKIAAAGKLPVATCRQIRSDAGSPRQLEGVYVDEVEHRDATQLGPYLVLSAAWESLEIDRVLADCEFSPAQRHTAKASVFNRLTSPGSENDLPGWLATTALGDLLEEPTASWSEDRFYRISDRLLRVRAKLEEHLREREQSLFRLGRTILLYDLTNSYFEGAAAGNPLARRSVNSKEKRSDCPLLAVGVVLDADGFLLTHQVFRGNVGDCRTLVAAVDGLRKACMHDAPPVVVVDGGIATKENLQYLRDHGFDYVVNGRRQSRAKFAADFLEHEKFTKIAARSERAKTPVFVRRLSRDGETIVLCRSEGRYQKENAIVAGAEKKLLAGLDKLAARIQRGDARLKLAEGPACVNRLLGRLTGRTTRASKLYTITYDHPDRRLTWQRRQEAWDNAHDLHGCYHLRSSLDLTDEQLWHIYMTLTRVEDSFRLMKSDLGLRPFYHQTENRCRGHIWLTILAYHLLRWIEHTLELSGYDGTWRKIRRLLATHVYSTLIIPTDAGVVHHHRKPGRPNAAQRLIYDLFGIDWTTLPTHKRTYRLRPR